MKFSDFRDLMCPDLHCWRMHRALWSGEPHAIRFYRHDRNAVWSRLYVKPLPCGHFIEADHPFQIYVH